MEEKYDIIVAGAGLAGNLAAAVAAKQGLNVVLLDRNPPEEAGKKTNWGWVCGDAVAESHLQFIREKLNTSFSYPELDVKVDGVVAISPNMKHKIRFDGEGYVLNRPAFEYKLLQMAIKNGAHHIPHFEVETPIIENNYVVGITGKDKDKQHKEIRAKIIIDALGIATGLRRKLPENPYVDKDIDINDIESTGRFIYEFDPDHVDLDYYDPKNALIHLNQELAPGGYGWVFPKKGNRINIGLGVQKKSLEIRNQKMGTKDNLHSLMDAYVKWNPIIKNVRLDNANNNGKGYWSVAVRRQLPSLVFNGYMGAGDSMAMPNPISAGGIGPALVAGILAGEHAATSFNNNDVSIKGLWKYNLDFNELYGKKTAGLEVFRVYLQSLNNDLINYGMQTFLTPKEAVDLSYGLVPELSVASKAKLLLQGAKNIAAFSNLVYVVKKMKELNEIYANYPKSPEEFQPWRHRVDQMMEEAKSKFQPNPI
ncbi:MAG: NAD(P)/FAD-dependent oxidoreductase [Candidatus Micrarchaeota archaeon]|nr:NAD(P)/FAD-dependent oxidoreductase [Candidatus Micrarchaeota archaeon]